MLTTIRRLPLTTSSTSHLVRRALLLLLSLSLLAVTLVGQTGQEPKRAAAEALYNEGRRLRDERTKESLEAALRKFTEALPLFRSLNDAALEADTLLNIGFIYKALDETQKALDHYTRALPIYHATGNRLMEALTLNNIGNVYDVSGEEKKALEYFMQALSLARAVGERLGEARTLDSIGRVYHSLGEEQKALDYHKQALLVMHSLGSLIGQAHALNNIGAVYDSLGEPRKALDYYTQALRLSRAVGDREGEAATLTASGAAYDALGEPQKALENLTRALPLFRAIGNRRYEAKVLNNIGAVYDSLGEPRKALDYYTQALRLSRAVGDREGEATKLGNIGAIYYLLGEPQKTRAYIEQALPLFQAIGDRRGEARMLYNFAFLERDSGDLDEALIKIEAALDIIESLRTKIDSQELRASYFAKAQNYYEFYIDLLMRLHRQKPSEGYDGKALRASERYRARSLLELLTEAHADIRQGVDPELLQRERSLQQLLNAKAERRARLLSGPHTAEQATASAKEIDALTVEYEEVKVRIRQTSPRYAALTQPPPLDPKDIQAQLDPDTLLLEYALGSERSYLWLVSPTDIQTFALPAREKIETAAAAFIEILKTDISIYAGIDQRRTGQLGIADIQRREMLNNALHLSRMLLGPVATRLGQKRLVIVGDGILLKLPFAALPDAASGKQSTANVQPLILQHEIVNLPSVSALVLLRAEVARRTPPLKDIAVLADPVFYPDDVRVRRSPHDKPNPTKARAGDTGSVIEKVEKAAWETGALRNGKRLDRLTGTREEADGIVRFVSANRAKLAVDFAANRELVNSGELSQYRYVHFATHGLLDNTHPELTAIVLSLVDDNGDPRDGFLRAFEIYNLNMPSDVVVLSACETGLGKEVKGEGLIGLTRGFMYAGAARVVVSLWAVRDESTAKLMVSFYRGMIKEGKRPAEALRAAQIELLKQPRWQAPHYWAAFVLQGEWK